VINTAIRIGALVLVFVLTIGLFVVVDVEIIRHFQELGYLGIFMISVISNASIALPLPSLLFIFMGGGTLNWVIVGLVAGAGEAIGESTGYLAGYGGAVIIENQRLYKRMQRWMAQYGGLTVFLLAAIPNPIIDLAGFAAGASGFGYFRFLLYCWVGKTIKTSMIALAGAYSVGWLLEYIKSYLG
jgi:membrane protein DedA with SNARE-associated domain